MNDEYIINQLFTHEEINAYKRIKKFQNKIGIQLEDYINTFTFPPDITFVGRDKLRPEGVDYIVNGEYWSIKNAWNTDNSAMKGHREDRGIKHWYRLNKDGSTNWQTLFISRGPSEIGFINFLGGKRPPSLDEFFI